MALALPERVYARRLTPDEVVALSNAERVPHLRDDPVVAAIRGCVLGNRGADRFAGARRRGYLVLAPGGGPGETDARLAALWGWWCAAAKLPEAVIDRRPRVDGGDARVRLDLSPTGRAFAPAVMGPIGRLCAQEVADPAAGWIATPDVVEVEAPDLDGATAIVLALLALARAERWLAPTTVGNHGGD